MAQVKNYLSGKITELKSKGKESDIQLQPNERLIHCMAAFGPGQALKPCAYVAGPLAPHEVEIMVHFCGFCHTDVQLLRDEMGMSQFPFTPGHEVVGIITNAGCAVEKVKVGDRVGVAFFKESCGCCEFCHNDRQNLCLENKPIEAKDGAKGGFSEFVRINEEWAIPIPEQLSSAEAAPFMCAGTTVYNPLIEYHIGPGSRVALIGLGGLGHLFVQMAAAMGAEVTVFSTHPEKEKDAKAFGAHRFIDEGMKDEDKAFEQTFDFIMNTAYASLDWSRFMKLLKPGGALCMIGVPPKAITIDPFELVFRGKKLVSSNLGSPKVMREMFDFVIKHNIRPSIQIFNVDDVNDVVAKFDKQEFRYRAVLDVISGYRQSKEQTKMVPADVNGG